MAMQVTRSRATRARYGSSSPTQPGGRRPAAKSFDRRRCSWRSCGIRLDLLDGIKSLGIVSRTDTALQVHEAEDRQKPG